MTKREPRYVPLPDDAQRYGFEWPLEGASRLAVQRTVIYRGTRVITIYTERDQLDIYVSPTGLIRSERAPREEVS